MRKLLLLLVIAIALVVLTTTAAYADYWPPDLMPAFPIHL